MGPSRAAGVGAMMTDQETALTGVAHAPPLAPVMSTAVLDREGRIVAVNEAWTDFCRANGGDLERCGPGVSYLEVCARAVGDPVAGHAADLVSRALHGRLMTPTTLLIPCAAPGTSGWYDMVVHPREDSTGHSHGAVVSFCERTDLGVVPPRGAAGAVVDPATTDLSSVVEKVTDPTQPGPRDLLTFPDVPRLELEESLVQLTERAADVLKAQGRLRSLLRANALVTADLKLEVVLHRLVRAARDLIGARCAALGVLAEDGSLSQFVHTGMDELQVTLLEGPPEGAGILGVLVDATGPVRLTDLPRGAGGAGLPGGHSPVTTFLGVPIRVRDTVFGTLYLTESTRGEFTEEDEQLLVSLARTAAVAIENARLYEDSERRRRWQTLTTEASQLVFAGEQDRPIDVVLQAALQGGEGDVAVLAELDGEDMAVAAAAGTLAEQVLGVHVPIEHSVLAPTLTTGDAALIDGYHHRSTKVGTDPQLASLIAAPLCRGKTIVGALMVGRTTGRRPFDQTDLDQLDAYAGHLGVALELNQSRADQAALAVLREHQRIAADLHDHVIQELFATGMGLQAMVYRTDDEGHRQHLSDFVDAIDSTIRRIRTTIFQLNRAPHGAGGLKERLLAVVEEARPALGFTAHAEFSGPLDQAVAPELADDVVAVAREALSNAARHAHARSVRLRVTAGGPELRVEAIDDG